MMVSSFGVVISPEMQVLLLMMILNICIAAQYLGQVCLTTKTGILHEWFEIPDFFCLFLVPLSCASFLCSPLKF